MKKFYILFAFSFLALFSASCKSDFLQSFQSPTANNASPSVSTEVPPSPVLADGSRTSYADIVDRVAPAVVKIDVEQKVKRQSANQMHPFADDPMFRDFFRGLPQAPPQGPQIQRGVGSGVIVSADGTVLTNNHVVQDADKITVEMIDKRSFVAKVVGTDPLSDLAVLKIEGDKLPFLTLGDSERVRVGDIILAIGNPLGIGQTVTAGIVSAKGRHTGLSDGNFADFLQIDAPINRGNSGGALINLGGELIGINSQILSPSGGNIGIGFSIPSNMAKSVMDQLIKDGKVRRGMLGINIQDLTDSIAQTLELGNQRGVLVSNVRSGSAADKAGIERGDLITAINGEKVTESASLRNRVAAAAPGSEIKLTILRKGKEMTVSATLDELSDEVAKRESNNDGDGKGDEPKEDAKLGLQLETLTAPMAKELELPADSSGLVVTSVDPAGRGGAAGIRVRDVILEANRSPVKTIEELRSALNESKGRPIVLLIARGGQIFYLPIEDSE